MSEPREFIAGLDLGQSHDFTALVILERTIFEIEAEGAEPWEDPARTPGYVARHIERWALGVPYPTMVSGVADLLSHELLRESTSLICDRTGVGGPVFDLLRERDLSPIGVAITSGDNVNDDERGYRVPKYELVCAPLVLAQTGRLRIAKSAPLADVLRAELAAFERKMTNAAQGGHEVFGARVGEHDDIVLALALACWYGESHPPLHMWGAIPSEPDASFSRFRDRRTEEIFDRIGWRHE